MFTSLIMRQLLTSAQNSSPPVISMDSFRLNEVNRFVQFLYTGAYNEHGTEDEEPSQDSQEEQGMRNTS